MGRVKHGWLIEMDGLLHLIRVGGLTFSCVRKGAVQILSSSFLCSFRIVEPEIRLIEFVFVVSSLGNTNHDPAVGHERSGFVRMHFKMVVVVWG